MTEGMDPRTEAACGGQVLACFSASSQNARVIRAAARLAKAYQCGLTALFVEPQAGLNGDGGRELRQNLWLARQMGARVVTVCGDDIPVQIIEYARAGGISRIVLGRSAEKRLPPHKTLAQQLAVLAPNLDLYIIPGDSPPRRAGDGSRRRPFRLSAPELLKSLGILLLCTLAGAGFQGAGVSDANIIAIYLLGVLFAAIVTDGRFYGGLVCFLGVAAYNFFFTEPRYTLLTYDAGDYITFLVMFSASLLTSSLTLRVKNQARQAGRKAYRTGVLLETSQKLRQAESFGEIYAAVAGQMGKLTGCSVLFYPAGEGGKTLCPPLCFPAPGDGEDYTAPLEREAALWALINNSQAGATADAFPQARCLYLPVRGPGAVNAVAAVAVKPEGLGPFELNLMTAMLAECSLALEKAKMEYQKRQAEMQAGREQLRSDLLRAVSHDLRTPLTSISGNAGILLSGAPMLDEEKKKALYSDIYDDSVWLISLVENLLSVTRLENGGMRLNMEPELVEEIFAQALEHLGRRAARHHISTRLSEDLLMAHMDAKLILQVVVNLVENAVKYTPAGSHILLEAKRQGKYLLVEVSDDGPGVPEEARARLFEMFYTAGNRQADGRRGLGLGLSLCRSIVAAHGGTVGMRPNSPRGAVFYFTLLSAEVRAHE